MWTIRDKVRAPSGDFQRQLFHTESANDLTSNDWTERGPTTVVVLDNLITTLLYIYVRNARGVEWKMSVTGLEQST